MSKRSVLITGCSDGGLGAALAVAFHEAGLHVYATARNPEKMKSLKAKGIETMVLDVMDEASISAAVKSISHLDILVNNAGAVYSAPFTDVSISEAKKLFDLNVWSYLAVTQAFLPLLLESKGVIVNNTSIAGLIVVPWQSAYNASKAAMAMFSASQRMELEPFGVKVVDLKTGAVKSNIFQNMDQAEDRGTKLPEGSMYEPGRARIERAMSGVDVSKNALLASKWAAQVVAGLGKPTPPSEIWAGGDASLVRIALHLPVWIMETIAKKMFGVDEFKQMLYKR